MRPLPRPLAPVVIVMLVSTLPFAGSGGCGRTACFQFTQEAYVKNGNACPAADMALQNFSDPQCPGSVTEVDGAGSFDADSQICCYPVTYEDISPNCGTGGAGGAGGAGGVPECVGETVSSTSGFGGEGQGNGGATVSSGTGPSCVASCALALTKGGAPCEAGASVLDYDALQACAGCTMSGACAGACVDLCMDGAVTSACGACLETDCAAPLAACVSH